MAGRATDGSRSLVRMRDDSGTQSPPVTTWELLARGNGRDPAILGADGLVLSFADVRDRVRELAACLAGARIERGSRVAVAVRNGPGAALSFLGVASAAVCAPLNPAYTTSEFAFSLGDLPAAALLTDGSVPAAEEAARELGVPVLTLTKDYRLETPGGVVEAPKPPDVALVLHTSGTTGRPKRVPLTHANLAHTAANVAETLRLSPSDRCLNVMPLFHIHGIVGALLSSLSAGASVSCEPGFEPFQVLARLRDSEATWYTAVPSIHQAVLARAARVEGAALPRLRFIRSSSSAMPLAVLSGLEQAFGVPLIEAYGMTENAHQIASNPLPPAERRPGSVGPARGVEVGVFGEDGNAVEPLAPGEVAIRGLSVTSGYEGVDPAEYRLPGGWLRTGDHGYLDTDGYLYLTGRIKELINRGGEKISPFEVEDALLAHPAVASAIAFSIPNDAFGEEVGAAVTLRAGESATPADVRNMAAARLAPFKVPRNVLVIEAIPLGPTGKPQRIGMAKRLGLA